MDHSPYQTFFTLSGVLPCGLAVLASTIDMHLEYDARTHTLVFTMELVKFVIIMHASSVFAQLTEGGYNANKRSIMRTTHFAEKYL